MLGLHISRYNSQNNAEERFPFFQTGSAQTCVLPAKKSTGLQSVNQKAFQDGGKKANENWNFSLMSFQPLSTSFFLLKVVIGGINVDFIAKAQNSVILV